MREQSLEVRAAVHAALAEPHRLAIVDALRPSDLAPSTLARLLGIDSNLIAHHIQVLVDAGLVERLVSSGDHRRRYLRLRHEALDRLFLPLRLEVNRVLFVCTQNSARSQLAAALWTQVHRRPGSSAGTHPAKRIHPLALQVASRLGLDLTSAVPHSLSTAPKSEGLLVTVCDQANEELTGLPMERLHWSIPDPVGTGTLKAFEQAYRQLHQQVEILATYTQMAGTPSGSQP